MQGCAEGRFLLKNIAENKEALVSVDSKIAKLAKARRNTKSLKPAVRAVLSECLHGSTLFQVRGYLGYAGLTQSLLLVHEAYYYYKYGVCEWIIGITKTKLKTNAVTALL